MGFPVRPRTCYRPRFSPSVRLQHQGRRFDRNLENLFPNWHFRVDLKTALRMLRKLGIRNSTRWRWRPERSDRVWTSAIPDGLFHPDKGWLRRHCTNEDGEIRERQPSHFFWATGARAGGLFFESISFTGSRFLTTFLLFSSEAFPERRLRLSSCVSGGCPMAGERLPGLWVAESPGSFLFPRWGLGSLTSRASPTGGVASESVPEDGGRASAERGFVAVEIGGSIVSSGESYELFEVQGAVSLSGDSSIRCNGHRGTPSGADSSDWNTRSVKRLRMPRVSPAVLRRTLVRTLDTSSNDSLHSFEELIDLFVLGKSPSRD